MALTKALKQDITSKAQAWVAAHPPVDGMWLEVVLNYGIEDGQPTGYIKIVSNGPDTIIAAFTGDAMVHSQDARRLTDRTVWNAIQKALAS